MATSFEANRKYNLHIRNFGTDKDGFFDIIPKGGVTVVWQYDAEIDEVVFQMAICRGDEMYSRKIGRETAEATEVYTFPIREFYASIFAESEWNELLLNTGFDIETLALDAILTRNAVEDVIIDTVRADFLPHFQKTNPAIETMGVYVPL
ncbi:hypothetical protein [Ralstonia phage RSP15]|uniref:hypothetical protein n=1 Tax=Ralstonia phage RSP15 TaxID=1785960 RepID=UPI00074D3301|nr:hypothetical protein BH754_gp066 [Ralstonia phage RSP15]BAU40024.1 hypothetical protein [Ralstonia phage RSP15]